MVKWSALFGLTAKHKKRGQMRFGALIAFELSTEKERSDKFEGAVKA